MMNRFVGVGRITKDLELRYTQSNIAFTKFTLAINRTFKGTSGEKETDFIQCVAWKNIAENTVKFCGKGSLVGVDGRVQTGSYKDKDGKLVYTTEIMCDTVEFLTPKTEQQQTTKEKYFGGNDFSTQSNSFEDDSFSTQHNDFEVTEDDIPF